MAAGRRKRMPPIKVALKKLIFFFHATRSLLHDPDGTAG
jgi:hypothetical protein